MATTSPKADRRLRSDARQNRDRILSAAAQAFAEDGLNVRLIDIARRAGVGNATVHRNFTKEQLVDELFCEWYAQRQAIAERAMADPDPWHGLVTVVEDVLGSCHRTVGALFAIRPEWRQQLQAHIRDLLARAQNAGAARADLTAEDVALVLIGIARTMTITCQTAPELWRRHLAIFLDGMRAEHTQRLPGLPATPLQFDTDLQTWSCQVLRTGDKWP